jgi:hypothetical protein
MGNPSIQDISGSLPPRKIGAQRVAAAVRRRVHSVGVGGKSISIGKRYYWSVAAAS